MILSLVDLIKDFGKENIILPKRARFTIDILCSLVNKREFSKFGRYILYSILSRELIDNKNEV